MSDAVAHADPHAAAHAHHPAQQHHFDTMSQQKEAAVLGMWVFLLTEILFFGGLFMAYMLYRTWYHDAFREASSSITLFWGLLNTIVLIGSSLTMALAVRSAQLSRRQATVNWLLLTMVLGAVFLGGTTFGRLHQAGQVTERTDGALERADVIFGTWPAPWCSFIL